MIFCIIFAIVLLGLLTFSLARISTISEEREAAMHESQELERQACVKKQ